SYRVLHILNPRPLPGPIMPVDVAMRLCLAHSPPLRSFLSSYEDCRGRNLVNRYKPLRPCISSKQEEEAASVQWQKPKTKSKKRVVFADSKGLSLTAIHVFSEFEEDHISELQFDLTDLEDATGGLKVSKDRNLVLDFCQPAADYLDFRNRLKKNFVCLENCSLQERLLAGTVKVKNTSFEKSVQIRITFDTWKSYTDVECVFMNNVYGCSETDTFSFVIDLPDFVPPHERVEFCISFKTQDQTFWDNNDEKNYRLVHTELKCHGVQVPPILQNKTSEYKTPNKPQEMEFDQFGSPRTSSGLFPEWQSWGQVENTAPYW
ncbi:PR3CB phosphatase, partial [Amia calva]|nr:PR3CB phosphatase [Amia calva]